MPIDYLSGVNGKCRLFDWKQKLYTENEPIRIARKRESTAKYLGSKSLMKGTKNRENYK